MKPFQIPHCLIKESFNENFGAHFLCIFHKVCFNLCHICLGIGVQLILQQRRKYSYNDSYTKIIIKTRMTTSISSGGKTEEEPTDKVSSKSDT